MYRCSTMAISIILLSNMYMSAYLINTSLGSKNRKLFVEVDLHPQKLIWIEQPQIMNIHNIAQK